MISGGKEPILEEEDEFRVCIPYIEEDLSGQQTTNKPLTNRQQTTNKPITSANAASLLNLLLGGEKSLRELMFVCGYKDMRSFRKSVLNEMLENGWVAMTHPENVNHRQQRYVITDLGRSMLS